MRREEKRREEEESRRNRFVFGKAVRERSKTEEKRRRG